MEFLPRPIIPRQPGPLEQEQIMDLFGQSVDNDKPFILLAGPCVVEEGDVVLEVAAELLSVTSKLGILLIFKASFEPGTPIRPS